MSKLTNTHWRYTITSPMEGPAMSLVLDTETTGLGPYDELVEIAIVDAVGGSVVYDAVIMPDGEIPAKASAVHGLDRNRLRAMAAEPWPIHHAPVSRILANASVVYAYNAEFDQRMLKQTARRYGLGIPESCWRCIMLAYARGGRRIRLSEACAREGIPVSRAHRALADARMARELLLRMEAG
jgi:DNA polymerase-3 subunit epsilon